MLSAHTLEIAAIAIPYFGLMIALGCYMAGQVRQHDHGQEQDGELADLTPRDEEPGPMLIAA